MTENLHSPINEIFKYKQSIHEFDSSRGCEREMFGHLQHNNFKLVYLKEALCVNRGALAAYAYYTLAIKERIRNII